MAFPQWERQNSHKLWWLEHFSKVFLCQVKGPYFRRLPHKAHQIKVQALVKLFCIVTSWWNHFSFQNFLSFFFAKPSTRIYFSSSKYNSVQTPFQLDEIGKSKMKNFAEKNAEGELLLFCVSPCSWHDSRRCLMLIRWKQPTVNNPPITTPRTLLQERDKYQIDLAQLVPKVNRRKNNWESQTHPLPVPICLWWRRVFSLIEFRGQQSKQLVGPEIKMNFPSFTRWAVVANKADLILKVRMKQLLGGE